MENIETNLSKDFLNQKFEEVQNKKLEENNNNKKGKKGFVVAVVAVILAAFTALTAFILSKKNNKANVPDTTVPTVSTTLLEEDTSLDELGEVYDELMTNGQNQYGNTTGDVDVDNIVEKDGVIWADQEAANNSDKVGQGIIDDKEDSLEITPDGEVLEKEEGYEINKEDGSTGTMDKDEFDDNYVYDENLDSTVEKEDANKFVEVDADYYNLNGELVYAKGERVTKETFEKIKNDVNLTTTKPVINEDSTEPEITEPEPNETQVDSYGGIINPNGTYTVYGTTYMDKATFEAFILDENASQNFGYYNGVIYPVSVLENINQKSK